MQRRGKPASRARQQAPRENPRLIALNILQDVSRADAYAGLALGKRLRESKLPQRDRNFVAELVYGTLEKRISLDYLLDKRLERPGDVESLVRDILRMGAYQILYLDRVPDSAAVDESVKLCRGLDRAAFAGLINGVLRGLGRDKAEGTLPWPERAEDPARYLSIVHSTPLWIVDRLIAAYGFAQAEAIAAYRPSERFITVRRTLDGPAPEAFEAMMSAKGWAWRPARLADMYYVSGIGDVGIDQDYLKGKYSVQGESSVLAAMAVCARRAQSILDACAAPGGKTAFLAETMHGTGRVYAWDVHEHRVELLRSMVRRLKLDTVRPAVRDATVVKEDLAQAMDAVLLDAPCSGLGVMLDKQDIKYRQTPETVASLADAQRALLCACCQYVRPGGILVYSTCSILPEENEEQVRAFLRGHPEFSLDNEGLCLAMPAFVKEHVREGMVQLFAHRDHTEGFFIARMQRAKR